MTVRPPPVLTARTGGAEATRELAGAVAGLVRAGDIVVLAGDLGTGKTVFVQGFARALGIDEVVTSPTFILVRPYRGSRLTLLHADAYRLDRAAELLDLGLLEELDGRAVACIEWGDLVEAVLPADFLEVRLEQGEGDDERTVWLRSVGRGWRDRADALQEAVAPWAPGR